MNRLKRAAGRFVLAVSLASAQPVFAGDVLSVVADEWPPFSGASLPGKGISVDVISTVLTRAGYKVKAEILPWARIMNGSRAGDHDIIGSLFFDPEIASYMTYGDPFYRTNVRFVQKIGAAHDVTSLEALKPYEIAVGDGFLYEEGFDRADDLKKVIVTTTLQGVRMVAHDRVDLTLDSEDVVNYALTEEDPELASKVEMLPHVLATHEVHMAVRKSHPEQKKVVADFNRVLAEMRADGSLDALLAKHR